MLVVIYKILLILLYIFLAISLASNMIGVPGNWILIGVAAIIGLVTYFTKITWGYFFLCLGLALLGELIESLLGTLVVAKKGGGRWGVIGSFFGGLLGVIFGSTIIPPIGSVIFGFIGAFTGAVLGELVRVSDFEAAFRIGLWSFVGRVLAVTGKFAVGCVIFWIIVTKTWS